MKKILMIMMLLLFGIFVFADENKDKEMSKESNNETIVKKMAKTANPEIAKLQAINEFIDQVKQAKDAAVESDELKEIVKLYKDDDLDEAAGKEICEKMKENKKKGISNKGIGKKIKELKEQGLKGKELANYIHNELGKGKGNMKDMKENMKKSDKNRIKMMKGKKGQSTEKVNTDKKKSIHQIQMEEHKEAEETSEQIQKQTQTQTKKQTQTRTQNRKRGGK